MLAIEPPFILSFNLLFLSNLALAEWLLRSFAKRLINSKLILFTKKIKNKIIIRPVVASERKVKR